jgi:hypothetical protein
MEPTCTDLITVVFNFIELASSVMFEKHVGGFHLIL